MNEISKTSELNKILRIIDARKVESIYIPEYLWNQLFSTGGTVDW